MTASRSFGVLCAKPVTKVRTEEVRVLDEFLQQGQEKKRMTKKVVLTKASQSDAVPVPKDGPGKVALSRRKTQRNNRIKEALHVPDEVAKQTSNA